MNVFFLFYMQLHMLGDGSRGAIIEMTLAKVLYMSSKSGIMIPFPFDYRFIVDRF